MLGCVFCTVLLGCVFPRFAVLALFARFLSVSHSLVTGFGMALACHGASAKWQASQTKCDDDRPNQFFHSVVFYCRIRRRSGKK